jgi:hypothetical protein
MLSIRPPRRLSCPLCRWRRRSMSMARGFTGRCPSAGSRLERPGDRRPGSARRALLAEAVRRCPARRFRFLLIPWRLMQHRRLFSPGKPGSRRSLSLHFSSESQQAPFSADRTVGNGATFCAFAIVAGAAPLDTHTYRNWSSARHVTPSSLLGARLRCFLPCRTSWP